MQWSKNPSYTQDLQIFVNWVDGEEKYYPETWRAPHSYQWHERTFKSLLCSEFAKVFGFRPYSAQQLREEILSLLTLKNIKANKEVRQDFAFLHSTEISRLNEWLRHEDDMKLWQTFVDLYTSTDDRERLTHFVDVITEYLKARGSESYFTPPMLTFWLAYYDPAREVFFKPQSTTEFYQKYGEIAPSGGVVDRYLQFRQDAMKIQADLESIGMNNVNMLDVQGFVWVIGTGYAW